MTLSASVTSIFAFYNRLSADTRTRSPEDHPNRPTPQSEGRLPRCRNYGPLRTRRRPQRLPLIPLPGVPRLLRQTYELKTLVSPPASLHQVRWGLYIIGLHPVFLNFCPYFW